MNKKTLQALKESIKHWQHNLLLAKNNKPIKIGNQYCALCQLNIYKNCESRQENRLVNCHSCIICLHTGEPACNDTPYYDVGRSNDCRDIKNLIINIKKEIIFLKSLLPKKKKTKKIKTYNKSKE
jgi:hypothetical protein